MLRVVAWRTKALAGFLGFLRPLSTAFEEKWSAWRISFKRGSRSITLTDVLRAPEKIGERIRME